MHRLASIASWVLKRRLAKEEEEGERGRGRERERGREEGTGIRKGGEE